MTAHLVGAGGLDLREAASALDQHRGQREQVVERRFATGDDDKRCAGLFGLVGELRFRHPVDLLRNVIGMPGAGRVAPRAMQRKPFGCMDLNGKAMCLKAAFA